MTIEEIEKLLFMLNSDDLISAKEYLLEEKKQKTFEKYIANATSVDFFTSNYGEGFRNGNSIYIIHGYHFNINTPKITSFAKKNKFKIIKNTEFNMMLNRARELYGEFGSEWYDEYRDGKFLFVKYCNIYDGCLLESKYLKEEFVYANTILENPVFKISSQNPIIKAEGKIGNAYIFGNKIVKKLN